MLAAALIAKTRRRLGKTIPLSGALPWTHDPSGRRGDRRPRPPTSRPSSHSEGGREPGRRCSWPTVSADSSSGTCRSFVSSIRTSPSTACASRPHSLASSGRLRVPQLARTLRRRHPAGTTGRSLPPRRVLLRRHPGARDRTSAGGARRRGRVPRACSTPSRERSPPPSRAQREATQLRSLVPAGPIRSMSYLQRRAKNLLVKARRAPWILDHWLHQRAGRPLQKPWDDVARVEALRVEPVPRSLHRALRRTRRRRPVVPVTYFRAGSPTAPEGAVRRPRPGRRPRRVLRHRRARGVARNTSCRSRTSGFWRRR